MNLRKRFGGTFEARLRNYTRGCLNFSARSQIDVVEDEAKGILTDFLITYSGRLAFENKIRALPAYLYRWGCKALKVLKMKEIRRQFLSEYF